MPPFTPLNGRPGFPARKERNHAADAVAVGCVALGLTLIAWAAFAALVTFVVLFIIHHVA